MNPCLRAFLEAQREPAMRFVEQCDIVDLIALGPSRYIAHLQATGLQRLDGRIVECGECSIGIQFPDHYLQHVHSMELFVVLDPKTPWHPNFAPFAPGPVCTHIEPGTPLVDLLYHLYDLWTWGNYFTGDDGVNREASAWLRQQSEYRFPLELRPLKRAAGPSNATEEVRSAR